MIELRHMDVRHFVIVQGSHLPNGCTIKWGCIVLQNGRPQYGLVPFRVLKLKIEQYIVFYSPKHVR